MKKQLLIFAALLFAQASVAADSGAQTVRKFKISFLNPGVEAELPLQRTTSLVVHPAIGYSFMYDSNDSFVSFINPYVDFQYRLYYNLDKNFAQSGTNNNTGGFAALKCTYNFKELYSSNSDYGTNNSLTVGAVWGMQWTAKHIYWQFNIGPGYNFNFDGDSGFCPMAEFSVGWSF